MRKKYYDLAFTDSVKKAQEAHGSPRTFADGNSPTDSLGEAEIAFIGNQDSFYMGTVGSSGWPYDQHRGGPVGFVKTLSPTTLAMADFRGNKQYISLGNFADDDRVSLFFMDYPRKARLKIFARAEVVALDDDADLFEAIKDEAYGAKIERVIKFTIEGYDWNCPQHITPRYTETDIEAVTKLMGHRIAELEAEIASLKAI